VNKAFAIATDDGRPYRLVRVAALAAVIFCVFWLAVVLLFQARDLARAAQQAAELQAFIRQLTQYSEVRDIATGRKLDPPPPETGVGDFLTPLEKSRLQIPTSVTQ